MPRKKPRKNPHNQLFRIVLENHRYYEFMNPTYSGTIFEEPETSIVNIYQYVYRIIFSMIHQKIVIKKNVCLD